MHTSFSLIVTLVFAPALIGQGDQDGQGKDPLQGHPLSYWIKQVSSNQWFKSKEALLVLQKVGPQAAAATTAVPGCPRVSRPSSPSPGLHTPGLKGGWWPCIELPHRTTWADTCHVPDYGWWPAG